MDVPDGVLVRIFQYLKPMDLFNVSRTCTTLRNAVIKNCNATPQFCEISLGNHEFLILATFSHNSLLKWNFPDVDSFFFTFQNFFHIFWKTDDVIVTQFSMDSGPTIEKVLNIFEENNMPLYCEHLDVKNGNFCFVEKLCSKIKGKKTLRMQNNEGNVEKLFKFHKKSPCSFLKNQLFMKNHFLNDEELHMFLKTWMESDDKTLINLQLKTERPLGKAVILKSMKTIPYDGRFTLQLQHYKGIYSHEESVILSRNDGVQAVVTVCTIPADTLVYYFGFVVLL